MWGLQITFLNDRVVINDAANQYRTDAIGFNAVETSTRSK